MRITANICSAEEDFHFQAGLFGHTLLLQIDVSYFENMDMAVADRQVLFVQMILIQNITTTYLQSQLLPCRVHKHSELAEGLHVRPHEGKGLLGGLSGIRER